MENAARNTGAPLRIGMIGAGFIAQVTHLTVASELAGCRVVAIADNRSDLRDAVARRFAIETQASDPSAVLERDDVDAIVVCMARQAAGPVVERALATGKPVLAEKPMAHTAEHARRLAGAAAAHGSPFTLGYMKRHDAGVALFSDVLAKLRSEGTLGEIAHVAMRDYCATYAVPVPHHFRSAVRGHARYPGWTTCPEGLPERCRPDYEYTVNVACHDINLLRHFFGDVLRPAVFRVRHRGVQQARLEARRHDVSLELGPVDLGRWEQTLDVYFRKGRLQLRLPSPLARQETARVVLERGGHREEISPPPEKRVWAFKAQMAHFIDVARGNAAPVADCKDALRDVEVIEDLWTSVEWSE